MIVRNNMYSSPGGDTIQVDMTAKYLRMLDINVEIKLANSKIEYSNYDLIHFFNIIRPDDILLHTKENIPFVISTIFVDYSEYEKLKRTGITKWLFKYFRPGSIEYIKALARWAKNGDKIKSSYYFWNGHDKSMKYLLARSKMLLPNSNSEYMRLSRYLKMDAPHKKIVNAIDPLIFNLNTEANESYRDHIICVGRIEGRKNQLNLIKALIDTEVKLTIIGQPSPNHINYYNACKQLASQAKNIFFLDHISHNELIKIYKAAKVHVLPSWFETTGLSSLEASVMECNIVVTKKGDTEEYFKDLAFYCDPDDIDSIRNSVLQAYKSDVDLRLRDLILNDYIWEKAAWETSEAYKTVLKN